MSYKLFAILGFMLVPHLLSYFVYKKPILFRNFCHRHGIDFIGVQYMITVIFRFIAGLLFISNYIFYLVINIYGLLFVVVGLWMIYHVWKLIGNNGIFYGKEMGLEIPKKNNLILTLKHPHYLGVVIFYLGLNMMFNYYEAQFIINMFVLYYIKTICDEN